MIDYVILSSQAAPANKVRYNSGTFMLSAFGRILSNEPTLKETIDVGNDGRFSTMASGYQFLRQTADSFLPR